MYFAKLSEGFAKCSERIAKPSERFRKCSEHIAKPSEGFRKLSPHLDLAKTFDTLAEHFKTKPVFKALLHGEEYCIL
jgi:hypothetical protein